MAAVVSIGYQVGRGEVGWGRERRRLTCWTGERTLRIFEAGGYSVGVLG